MGNTPSTDLKDYKATGQLDSFMNQVKKDNQDLINASNKLASSSVDDPLILDNFAKKLIESETICNKPKFVFWLSKEAREECIRARVEAYGSFTQVINKIHNDQQTREIQQTLKKQIKFTQSIIETNKDL